MKYRSTKLKKVAKSTEVEPVTQGDLTPPQIPTVLKRGPGRPRKVNPFEKPVSAIPAIPATVANDPKLLTTFRRALADAEQAFMTPADFDGGGTAEGAPTVTKESLQRRVTRRLNVVDRYLTDEKLIELLAFSNLKRWESTKEFYLISRSCLLDSQT